MADETNISAPETPSSEGTTPTTNAPPEGQNQSPTSSSTTDGDGEDEKIDLAKAPAKEGEGDKPKEGEGEDDKPAENAELFGAPAEGEEYQIDGLPEGMTVDKEALEAFAPIARELNLSNAGMSRIAGAYAEKVLPHVTQQVTAGIEQRITAQRADWEAEARDLIRGKNEAGEELVAKNAAGDPLKFDSTDMKKVQAVAAKALDKLAPEGFRKFLDETGLAVHPKMVAFAYQAGLLAAEDRDFEDAGVRGSPKSRAEKYYG